MQGSSTLCLDGTLQQKRKITRMHTSVNEGKVAGRGPRADCFRKQHAHSSQPRPLSIPSRSTDDFSDTIAGIRASGLSFALQREERRADQLCAAFQAIGPVVSEIAERLRRKEERKKLETELGIAKETISELSKDVEQLTLEVKLLSGKNVSLMAELDACAGLKSSFETSVRTLTAASEAQFSNFSVSLTVLEDRLCILQSKLTACLQETLTRILELNEIAQARAEEEARLRREVGRLNEALRQQQEYAEEKVARMETEGEELAEKGTALAAEVETLRVSNSRLEGKAREEGEKAAEENEKLSKELEEKEEELSSCQTQVRIQSLELSELRKEISQLTEQATARQERELTLSSELLRLRQEIKEMQTAYAAFEDELRSEALQHTFKMVHTERQLLAAQRRKAQSVDIDSSDTLQYRKKTVMFSDQFASEESSEGCSEEKILSDIGEDWRDYELVIETFESCHIAGKGDRSIPSAELAPKSLSICILSPVSAGTSESPVDFSLSPDSERRTDALPTVSWREDALMELANKTPELDTVITTYMHDGRCWKLLKSQKNGYFWRAIPSKNHSAGPNRSVSILERIQKMVSTLLPDCEDVLEGIETLLARIPWSEEEPPWKRVEKPLFETGEEKQHTPFPRASVRSEAERIPQVQSPLQGAVYSLLCELPPLNKAAESAISRVLTELQASSAVVKQVEEARSKSSPSDLSRVAAW